jgi:hypothetical protein
VFVLASQIFSIVLAAVAITKSYLGFRAKVESLQLFILWATAWIAIVVIALFPSIIDRVIFNFGSGRAGLGTFFGMALVFLFFVVYRIYLKLERIEQNLTKTIQALALREDWMSKRK